MGVLLVGGFVGVNAKILGWMINENVSHDMIMMKNHGFGLSWGIPLRRELPLSV